MDASERDIYLYVKPLRNEFVPAREIVRRAGGKRRFHEEPEWAWPVLERMVERGILETNVEGFFRLKPYDPDPEKRKRWVSPMVRQMLEKSGRDFTAAIISEDDLDRYYDSL